MTSRIDIATKDICEIAVFSLLLFAQEQALALLPNIQLTVFLLFIYTRVLGFKKTIVIIPIYLLLDCILMGALIPLLMVFQLIGWLMIPIMLSTVFRKVSNSLLLSFIGVLSSLIYSWILIIPSCFIFKISFTSYLFADIVFELLLALSSFVSILILYDPVKHALDKLLTRNSKNDSNLKK